MALWDDDYFGICQRIHELLEENELKTTRPYENYVSVIVLC